MLINSYSYLSLRRTSTPYRRSESEDEDFKPRGNNKDVLTFRRGQEERLVHKGTPRHSKFNPYGRSLQIKVCVVKLLFIFMILFSPLPLLSSSF
jgi:hypothetical protein